MIEQVGNAVDFYAFFVASKVGKTGLTDVTIDVYRAGTLIVTAAATVEVGGGLYRYTLASGSTTVVGEYAGIFKTADATVDQQWIPTLWVIGRAGVEFLTDPMASVVPGAYVAGTAGYVLGQVGTADVVVYGPTLLDGGTLTLVRGDDYLAEDARAIEISSADWPDLTGAEIRMTVRRRREAFGTGSDPVWFTVLDSYPWRVAGVPTQLLRFELTKTDTAALVPGVSTGKWDVQAILATASPSASPSPSPSVGASAGNVVTLVQGVVTVLEDQTRA
jgi:hypothetical protein